MMSDEFINVADITDIEINQSQSVELDGKSILIEGISLILGKRADLSVNRDKSKKCIIEGVFDVGSYNLKTLFDENELDYETETIIRREISSSGKL